MPGRRIFQIRTRHLTQHNAFQRGLLWDGCPAAGRSLELDVGVETHRGGLCGEITLSGVSNEDSLKSAPEEPQDGLEGL